MTFTCIHPSFLVCVIPIFSLCITSPISCLLSAVSADHLELDTVEFLWDRALVILCDTLMAPKSKHIMNTFLKHSNLKPLVCKWSFMYCTFYDAYNFWHVFCMSVCMCLGLKGVVHCVGGPLVPFSPHLGMLQYHSLIGLKLS